MNGGKNCTGAENMTMSCNGEAKETECAFVVRQQPVVEKGNNFFSTAGYVGFILVAVGGIGAFYNHHRQQQKHLDDYDDDGEECHHSGGGDVGGDFWGGNDQQDCAEAPWDQDDAEDETVHQYRAEDGW
jgi:hypothetical protein